MVAVGSRFGPYEILAPLGAGGMGEVYRARDTRLGRDVALKVLSDVFAHDPDRLARFEREAKAVAALAHPNILVLHDFGEHEGTAFAVTELLEGDTLRQRLERPPLPWRKAVDLAAALADGLAAAHGKGIVHRDIKPENVFVTADGRVKILDFGIAHIQDDLSASPVDTVVKAAGQTDTGMILGTVGYMSPEQVRAQTMDGRSDIFSLGCVLYEMLTGERPFLRDTTADTMAAILTEELPEIPGIPLEIGQVVRRCLEKNREERFQSARDLAFALRTAATSVRTSSDVLPVSVLSSPPVKAKRQRWWIATAGVALLLAVVAAGFFFRTRGRDVPPPASTGNPAVDAVAVLPFFNAAGDASLDYLSDGIADSLSHSLSQVRSLKVRPWTAVGHYRGRDIDIPAVARDLRVDAVVTGRFLKRGDECTIIVELVDTRDNSQILWGGQFVRTLANILPLPTEPVLAIAERLRPSLAAEDRQRLTKRFTENAEANQLYLLGRYYWNKRTLDAVQKAIESFRKAIERDPSYALAYSGLADCHVVFVWFNEEPPERAYREARAGATRALQLDDGLAEAHAALAFVAAYCDWDWAAADRGFRRTIELNPNYATGHQWYGRFLSSIGRHEEAVAEVRQAQRLDPSSLIINANLAGALLYAGRLEEALQQGRAAVEMEPRFPIAHAWLGNIYERLGKIPEACDEYRQAFAVYPSPKLEACLGSIYGSAGKKDEARQVLARLKQQQAKGHYLSPATLAGVYAGLGEKDEAFRLLEQACIERDPWLVDLCVDQTFAPLRTDPRFAQVLQRMKFPR